jgi:hypothetical protein
MQQEVAARRGGTACGCIGARNKRFAPFAAAQYVPNPRGLATPGDGPTVIIMQCRHCRAAQVGELGARRGNLHGFSPLRGASAACGGSVNACPALVKALRRILQGAGPGLSSRSGGLFAGIAICICCSASNTDCDALQPRVAIANWR